MQNSITADGIELDTRESAVELESEMPVGASVVSDVAEGEVPEATEGAVPPKKKKRRRKAFNKRKFQRGLFIVLMMAYPVLQFVIMWAFVNIDSILMTFQKYDGYEWKWVGFENYSNWFESFRVNPDYKVMLVNSALHSAVGMFIIFPLCLMMAYFLCRKLPLSGFFRIIFYLPSIIPLVVLTMGFSNMLKPGGLLPLIWQGYDPTKSLLLPPRVRWTIYGFTIWAGLGGNLLLLSGTIKRVPSEVLESASLDGIGTMGELFRIVIPMIWPTLVTMFIMSMMGIFTVVFQPLFLTDSIIPDTMTIGLWIFNNATSKSGNVQAATLGIMCTIVVAPIVLITRWALDKAFANINY